MQVRGREKGQCLLLGRALRTGIIPIVGPVTIRPVTVQLTSPGLTLLSKVVASLLVRAAVPGVVLKGVVRKMGQSKKVRWALSLVGWLTSLTGVLGLFILD